MPHVDATAASRKRHRSERDQKDEKKRSIGEMCEVLRRTCVGQAAWHRLVVTPFSLKPRDATEFQREKGAR